MLLCISRPLSWKKLLDRDMSSPFRPKVGHVDSVENFDKLWTDMAPEDSPCNTPPAADLNTFQVLPTALFSRLHLRRAMACL